MQEKPLTIQGLGLPPYEVDEFGLRYMGDAYNLLESMTPHSVHAVLTDPPYQICIANEDWDIDPLPIDWLAYHFDRVTNPDGHVFVFCSDHQFGDWYRELGKYFTKLCKFAWCKDNPAQLKNKKLKDFADGVELAIHASNGNSYFNQIDDILNHNDHPTLLGKKRAKKGDGSSLHPTQKPIPLLDQILNGIAREGDLILDPFAGTHSLAKAARERNLRYITSDITPYCCWNPELHNQQQFNSPEAVRMREKFAKEIKKFLESRRINIQDEAPLPDSTSS
jgi:DNA modification methylase